MAGCLGAAGRSKPGREPSARVGRVDHRIEFERGRHVDRLALRVVLVHMALEERIALRALGNGRQFLEASFQIVAVAGRTASAS